MKNHIVFKFIAIVLCALALFSAIASGLGVIFFSLMDINGSAHTAADEKQGEARNLAEEIALEYASKTLGNCPDRLVQNFSNMEGIRRTRFPYGNCIWQIRDADGNLLEGENEFVGNYDAYSFDIQSEYRAVKYGPYFAESYDRAWDMLEEELKKELTKPLAGASEDMDMTVTEVVPQTFEREDPVIPEEDTEGLTEETEATEETMEDMAEPTETKFPVEEEGWEFRDQLFREYTLYGTYRSGNNEAFYFCSWEPMPLYQVDLYIEQGAWRDEALWSLVDQVSPYQTQLVVILGGSLLVFGMTAAFLCVTAGRKPGSTEVRPAGLNCLPLDLYFLLAGSGIFVIVLLLSEYFRSILQKRLMLAVSAAAYSGYAACLMFVAFCFAAAAQFKTPGLYWWHHSVCGFCWRIAGKLWGWCWTVCKLAWGLGMEFLHWCWQRIPGAVRKTAVWALDVCRALWAVALTAAIRAWKKAWVILQYVWTQLWALLSRMTRAIVRVYSLLPLTWQWLLTGFVMVFILANTLNIRHSAGPAILGVTVCVALVMYGATAFGTLLESTRRMRNGDLESKVEDKLLVGAFKEFAGELNGLADVAVVAAQKQLKSERMKTELITNVSHDIKTPLTSIINYVDLLQKPHTGEEEQAYLEVLSRQSQRMKKLIDDLMEMSKASTGNLPVELARMNAVEAVNQALGEFDDKFRAAQLVTVYQEPEEPIYIYADGRLVWRTMSNLLSNAVKYALPGTRLYVDVQQTDGKVLISTKNISREQLNISAEELMERFVRGDASRNTEGSGLGLNIARSLMELQHGRLELLVDGDLFKVTMVFPEAK